MSPIHPHQAAEIIERHQRSSKVANGATLAAIFTFALCLLCPMVRFRGWQWMSGASGLFALYQARVALGANDESLKAQNRYLVLHGASEESAIYELVESVSPKQDAVEVAPAAPSDPIAAAITAKWSELQLPAQYAGVAAGSTFSRYRFRPVAVATDKGDRSVQVPRYLTTAQDLQLVLQTDKPPLLSLDKGAIAVDVPNAGRLTCEFSRYVQTENRGFCDPLEVAIGVNLSGQLVNLNLSDPNNLHILIGGTTGSGKSEMVRSLLASVMARFNPDAVQFVIIDFKGVDFTEVEGSPYLRRYCREVYEVREELSKLCSDMDTRYKAFKGISRDVLTFNAKVQNPLPRVVLVCDEYADLIDQCDKEDKENVDTNLGRLGQKARGAGIHLVIGTQKPVVRANGAPNGLPTVLKGNLPVGIGLRTRTSDESIVVIGQTGCENLLGKGDLLLRVAGSAPDRLQALLASSADVERVASRYTHTRSHQPHTSVPPVRGLEVQPEPFAGQSHQPISPSHPIPKKNDSAPANNNTASFLPHSPGESEISEELLPESVLTQLMQEYAKQDPDEMPLEVLRQAIAFFDVRLGISGQTRFIEMFWGVSKSGKSAVYDRARLRYQRAIDDKA